MKSNEAVFSRIATAIQELDSSVDAYIHAVDDRLQELGVAVEAYLAEPVDTWTRSRSEEVKRYFGHARIDGRWGLALRTVRTSGPGTVGPDVVQLELLRDADRVDRIAVVDQIPAVLAAIEAELERLRARVLDVARDTARHEHDRRAPGSIPIETPVLPPVPVVQAAPAVPPAQAIPAAAAVPAVVPAAVVPAAPVTATVAAPTPAARAEVAPAAAATQPPAVPQETDVDLPLSPAQASSVDHMFRLFKRN
jgi:hypothetical protein